MRLYSWSARSVQLFSPDPADRSHLRALCGKSLNGGAQRLAGHLHVVRVGMEQCLRVAHDADMTLPEHEITALQGTQAGIEWDRNADPGLLHVGIAPCRYSAGSKRHLDQAGTV
jgi:hypothetical protein